MLIKKLTPYVFIIILLAFSCGEKKSNTEAEQQIEEPGDATQRMAISMGNNVSVRAIPSTKGDKLTSIAIGESVVYLDSTVIDQESKQKFEYTLIELSDGTKGWAVGSYLYPDATLAVANKNCNVYDRPDLMAVGKKSLQGLDLLAIIDQQAEWRKVVARRAGESSKIEGWINAEHINFESNDVLLTQMGFSALEAKDEDRERLIQDIQEKPEFTSSSIYPAFELKLAFDPDRLLKDRYKEIFILAIDSIQEYYEYGLTKSITDITIRDRRFTSLNYGSSYYLWDFFNGFVQSAKIKDPDSYDTEYAWLAAGVEKISGVRPYTESIYEFSRTYDKVNPEFVYWVRDNMLAHPEDDYLGVSTQDIYSIIFQDRIRYTYDQYRMMMSWYDLEDLSKRYMESLDEEGYGAITWLEETFYDSDIDQVIAGTFIRRHMDGSLESLVSLLKKTLLLYDSEWYFERLNYESY